MGQLLAMFSNDASDIIINLEGAQPDEAAAPLYEKLGDIVRRGMEFVASIEDYPNSAEKIRQAIAAPQDQAAQREAFESILPNAIMIKGFYTLASELGTTMGEVLDALSAAGSLQAQEALAVQLSHALQFVMRFDTAKMENPQIQNDFAYYRRSMGAMGAHFPLPITEAETNVISMFVAQSAPMLKGVSDALAAAVNGRPDALEALAMLANVCASMVNKKRLTNDGELGLCFRAMTGAILVFDHSEPRGAYHSRSTVQLKKCVAALRVGGDANNGLLSALKFSSKHYKDSTTPPAIKNLL